MAGGRGPDAIDSSTDDVLAVGTVVAGKYHLDRRLGAGAMGTVWACTHLGLGERVAVKFVSSKLALSAEMRSRFVREARAAARLNSRFTVRVFDTGELQHGTPYIVMEYLDGETLDEQLQREGQISLAETARIVKQIARGLTRAHDAGIVHRDIKPENIFMAKTTEDGVIAKIFDFGVAKVAGGAGTHDATETGVLIGTPQFMSPEQALAARDVDHRADIYSLGVVAHRMLTGKRLFPSESFAGVLMQICASPLPRLREALPEAPQALEDWFQRTCAHDRNARFPTAMACAEAFVVAAGPSMGSGANVLSSEDSVVAFLPAAETSDSPKRGSGSSARRNRRAAALGAALAVSIGAMVAFGSMPRAKQGTVPTNQEPAPGTLPPPASTPGKVASIPAPAPTPPPNNTPDAGVPSLAHEAARARQHNTPARTPAARTATSAAAPIRDVGY
jgi:eukaryotic-like serine/threonine-protein kinase